MIRVLAILVFSAFFSCAPLQGDERGSRLATDENSHCYGTNIVTFSLPIYPSKRDSEMFTYRLQMSERGDPNKPVIVFLPGGPGYPSMGTVPRGLPEGYRYITTDQRGTGCNNLPDSRLPMESISSANMAEDVYAAIKELRLNDYVIYGHSFGTLHATKVVTKLENQFRQGARDGRTGSEQIVLPQALVLEGTLGKAFPENGYVKSHQAQWEKVKSQLSDRVNRLLASETLPFSDLIPDSALASNWGTYLRSMLYFGSFPTINGHGDLKNSLMSLDDPLSDPLAYERLRQSVKHSVYQGFFPQFLQVDCSELFNEFDGHLLLQNGNLVGNGTDLCESQTFEPYDSSTYYISTPTFYYQGDADPATPLWQAQYHFQNHGAASRVFVQLEGIGHEPLQSALAPCRTLLWNVMIDGREDLRQALQQCSGVREVETEATEANAIKMVVKWHQ